MVNYSLIIGITLYLIHFSFRSPSDNHTRPIKGDAEAYYAYLPALFIYNDPTYSFIEKEEIEKKYYFSNSSKSFLVELENGEKVNKTFPGISILYLPFFLLSHLIGLLFGLTADGYSDIYQYLFDFGHFFYATLGLIFYCKALAHFRFRKWKIILSLLILLLGTNLWYYITLDQSVSHVHNFFLINLATYLLLRFVNTDQIRFAKLLILTLGLIILIRPTNIITVPFLLIFIKREQIKKLMQPKLLQFIIPAIIITIAIPILLWKWQAGVWIAYSYGEETFDFSNPQIFNFLFSYIKGWFVYTPIAFLILLIGIPIVLKRNKRQGILMILFYSLSIFIFSSWWCWYYGCTMSQRVMVDHYLLLGLIMIFIINFFKRQLLYLLSIPAAFLILLNQIQAYQVYNGFFPCAQTTSEMYWDHFMCLTPKAKIYEKDSWKKQESFSIRLPARSNNKISIGESVYNDEALSSDQIFSTGSGREFTGNIRTPLLSFVKGEQVVISVWVQAKNIPIHSRMVVELTNGLDSYRDYSFMRYFKLNQWIKMEFLYDIKETKPSKLLIYFWNPELNEEIWIDDIVIEKFEGN